MRLKPTRTTGDGAADADPETEYYVLGGGHVGAAVARRLHETGHAVTVIDETHESTDLPGVTASPRDIRALEAAGLSAASTVVVATPRDRQNLLVAQLVRAHFDVPEIVVLANTPDRLDLFAAAGHETVCATTALSDALMDNLGEIERPLDQHA